MGRILEVIGRNLMLPGVSIDATGSFVQPLSATGGGVVIAAATANQAITSAVAGRFQYMTDIMLYLTFSAAVAATLTVLDASGGTVLVNLNFTTAPAVGAIIPLKFSNPLRTATAGGQFFITTTGAAITWIAVLNGYTDNSLGN